MTQHARPIHPVQRPLERDALVRARSGVERHRRAHRLEVEVERRRTSAQRAASVSAKRGLDEPTEGIQPNIIQQIGEVIDYLKSKGTMAVVLVEQYFDFAWARADQVYVFRRGAVALSGPASTFEKAALRREVSV